MDTQIDYFQNSFIPYLRKTIREGDILIHTGNIFYSKQTAHFKVLKDVFDIFDKLSKLMKIFILKGPNDEFSIDLFDNKEIKIIKDIKKIKNIMFIPHGEFLMTDNDVDYLFYSTPLKEVIEIKKSFNGFYENEKGNDININITSPYQLNKDFSMTSHGFFAFSLKQNEVRFIENSYSPKFKEIYIDDLSQIYNIDTNSNNFVDLVINSKITERTEDKNKVDIFLSKNNFNNVYFTEDVKKDSDIIIRDENDIRSILVENAENEIVEELKDVFDIYDKQR